MVALAWLCSPCLIHQAWVPNSCLIHQARAPHSCLIDKARVTLAWSLSVPCLIIHFRQITLAWWHWKFQSDLVVVNRCWNPNKIHATWTNTHIQMSYHKDISWKVVVCSQLSCFFLHNLVTLCLIPSGKSRLYPSDIYGLSFLTIPIHLLMPF